MGSQRKKDEPDYLINGKICHLYYENYNNGNEQNALPCCNAFIAQNIENFHKILKFYGLDRAKYAERKDYDPELDLVTVIDAIYEKDGENWLIDYKTGKLYKPKMAEIRFELGLYAYSAQKHLGITIHKIGMFFTNYPDDSFVEKITQKKIESQIAKYKERVSKINNLQFNHIRGPLCKHCDFIHCCEQYQDDIVDQITL